MTSLSQTIQLTAKIPEHLANHRLDQAIAELFPQYSRTRLKTWVVAKQITVNGEYWAPRMKVCGGETITICAVLEAEGPWQAEPIVLNVIYEDEAILIINKPPGLVVHPAAGNWEGTLVNALLHHVPSLNTLPRAGIVHRLDKDTSGLLMVAKTLTAHTHLVEQLQNRTVKREYDAIVQGPMIAGKTLDMPIGRHPIHRKRMAVTKMGKPAITHYRVLERFSEHTHIKVQLETGRTHQIRVHMAAIRHPLVGDQTYGGRLKIPAGAGEHLTTLLRHFKRQALHASKLSLLHPLTGEECSWAAPLPQDMKDLLEALRN